MAWDSRHRVRKSALHLGMIACASLLAPPTYPADIAVAVAVSNAWIRWLPANLPAAGYVALHNVSDQTVTLIGASTPDYARAMFHESRNQHGVEKMLLVQTILIRAHAEVAFAPDGYHIMLMEPKRVIQPGDNLMVTLHFTGGQSLPVQFEVRKSDGSRVKSAASANAASRQ